MAQIKEQSLTMRTVDERVLTSIENNLANSETVAFAKGKIAALEKMNAEAPEADAVTALEEAVDDYYSTVEKNILTHWEIQTSEIHHHVTMATAHADVSPNDWFSWGGRGTNGPERETISISLITGETYDLDTTSFGSGRMSPMGDAGDGFVFIGGSSTVETVLTWNYKGLLSSVADRSSSVKTKLEGFIGDLYLEYGAGDIPTEDVIDPVTAATQLSQNTGMAGQAAEAAML